VRAVAAARSNRLTRTCRVACPRMLPFRYRARKHVDFEHLSPRSVPGALDLTESPFRVWALGWQSPLGRRVIAVFRSWHCLANWQTLPSVNSSPFAS
jgi:hypothetical protein